jgi:hypothetical protein
MTIFLKYLYWAKTQEQNDNIFERFILNKNAGAKWQYFWKVYIEQKRRSKMTIFLKYLYWAKSQEQNDNICEIFILNKNIGAKW